MLLKLDQIKLSNLVQTCLNLFKLVQTCPNLSKLVQTCQNLSKLVQTRQNLFRLVQTCPNLSKLVQTCPNLSKLVQTCPNLTQISVALTKGKKNLSKQFRKLLTYLLTFILELNDKTPDCPTLSVSWRESSTSFGEAKTWLPSWFFVKKPGGAKPAKKKASFFYQKCSTSTFDTVF